MEELIIDGFAGGGGASLGIAWALGRAPDIAINHDPAAIAMHERNHPSTLHLRDDVWNVSMRDIVAGREVGLVWVSPDCKHFSRAKGSKPVSKNIRSLAWVAIRWAQQVKPRVLMLENVREFEDWGPLVPVFKCRECEWLGTKGQAIMCRVRSRCPRCNSLRLRETEESMPDPNRKGLTFRRFVGRLKALGYKVEWRNLNASDFGAPTHRRRLFLIARRDGEPIVWPAPTHGDPKKLDSTPLFDRLLPWRTAAECIDWDLPCQSIFERKRPLKEATLRRIAMGIKRYVIESERPFIVRTAHGEPRRGRGDHSIDEPLKTVAATNDFAVVAPILSKYHGQKTESDSRCKDLDEPFNTLDTQPRFALVSPILTKFRTGSDGQRIDDPMPTVTANSFIKRPGGCAPLGVVAPILSRQFGKSIGSTVDSPAPTTTAGGGGKTAVVAASLIQSGYGEREGQAPRALDIEAPLGTVVAGGCKAALVSAFIAKHFGGVIGTEVDNPLPTTLTSGCQNQLVAASLVHMNHGEKQWSEVDEPLRTVTSSNHAALVYGFLTKYFSTAIGQSLEDPAHTVTSKDRFGLVTVMIDGDPYVIVDIGMRMLTPRELARAQGFPDTYELTGTKTSQVARIGNSVCPVMAKVLVEANVGSLVGVSQ